MKSPKEIFNQIIFSPVSIFQFFFNNIIYKFFFAHKKKETRGHLSQSKKIAIYLIFPKKGLYDYESKYTKGFTDYFCPADIKSDLTKTIQSKALKIHKLLECRHYSRVDFILDKNLKPWFLEVNTLPGMTETSLVPKSAAVAGLSFEELIEKIIMESLIDE